MVIIKGQQGKLLERHIDIANRIYRTKGIADCKKVPTPIQITKRLKFGQVQGRLERPQWVDYVGISKGRAIAFEAKETHLKTRFDLSQLKEHQLDLLHSYNSHNGYSFVIVSFVEFKEVYLLPYYVIEEFINNNKKSIPYKYFKENLSLIGSNDGIPLDYIKLIEQC